MAGRPNGSIQELIKVTEERTKAEERVRQLLHDIERSQEQTRESIQSMVREIEMMSRCVNAVQQMLVLVAEYMAILAVRDTDQVQDAMQQLLAKSGVTFGPGADVDIGGDMVGGDQKGGRDGS